MFASWRRIRASIRRTTLLIAISCLTGLIFIETAFEFAFDSENPSSTLGTVVPMLNHSQMLSTKAVRLEPSSSSLTCTSKVRNDSSQTNASILYPVYIIVQTRAVVSANSFHRRMFTRASWGREARLLGIPVIYAAGRAADEQIQKKIEYEHKIYDDFLQFNDTDIAHTMSTSTADILHWFVTRGCQWSSSYLLMVDDDVLINIPSLLQMIGKRVFQTHTVYGLDSKDPEPQPIARWRLRPAGHRNPRSPSILYPSPIIDPLVQQLSNLVNHQNQSIVSVDDVLTSENITEQLGLQRAPMLGLDDCAYIDLFSRTIISGCASTRRIYVWSKFILSRIGQNTREIDRLIQTTTLHIKSNDGFYRTHHDPELDSPIVFIRTSSSSKILSIIVFAFALVLFSKFIRSRQSTSCKSSPLNSVPIEASTSMSSTPIK